MYVYTHKYTHMCVQAHTLVQKKHVYLHATLIVLILVSLISASYLQGKSKVRDWKNNNKSMNSTYQAS